VRTAFFAAKTPLPAKNVNPKIDSTKPTRILLLIFLASMGKSTRGYTSCCRDVNVDLQIGLFAFSKNQSR
jgi:hypothetical protein